MQYYTYEHVSVGGSGIEQIFNRCNTDRRDMTMETWTGMSDRKKWELR